MGSSALLLALGGIAGSFLPQEILAAAGVAPSPLLAVFVQLHGAILIAFAMVNWMGKESLIGGIYNRPVAVGNTVHFTAGALALLKFAMAGGAPRGAVFALAAIYSLFAIGFGRILFVSPVRPERS